MKKLNQWLNRQSEFTIGMLGLLLSIGVFTFSRLSSGWIAVTPQYMLIVVTVAWLGGVRLASFIALADATALGMDEFLDMPDATVWFLGVNLIVRMGMFFLMAFVVVTLRTLKEQLEFKVRERTRELAAEIEVRQRTEAQLRERNEQFRQVTDSINEVFWISDVGKNQMVYISPGYEKIWGRTCESLYASPRVWLDAVHPEERDRVLQAALTKQVTGEYDEEYRITRSDGSQRWIHDRAFPVHDDAGVVYRIVGIAEDITERRRVAEELQVNEQRLRMALESADMVTWEWDVPAGTIRYSDNTRDIVRGHAIAPYCAVESLVQEVHPEDRTALTQAIQRTVTEGCPFACEYRVKMLDGVYRWILGRGKVVEAERGKAVRVLGVSQDITDRKESERLLQIQSQVLSSMAEAALLIGEDGVIRLANPAASLVFGCEPSELVGAPLSALTTYTPEENARLIAETFGRIRRLESWTQTFSCRKKDGTLFPAEARFSCLEINGKFHAVVVGQDITGRIQLEEEMRRLNTKLEELVRERTAQLERANKTLQARERQLNLTLEAANAGSWSWNVSTNRSTGDERYNAQYGFEANKAASFEAWLERIHPEDRRRLTDRIQEMLKPGADESWNEQFRVQHPVKGLRWMLGLGRASRNSEGQVEQFSGINLDITERELKEQALHERNEILRAVNEGTNTLTCVKDRQGRIISLNPAMARFLGKSEADLVGADDLASLPDAAQAAKIREHDRHIMETGNTETVEIVVDQPGRRWELLFTKTPYRDASNRIIGVMGVGIDIAGRKRGEEALRESEMKYRRLHESMADAFVIVGMDGRIQEFNRAYREMLGYADEELRQLTYVELTPQKWHAFEALLLERSIIPHGASGVYEKEYRRKDGTIIPIELRTFLLRDDKNQPFGMWAIVRDISERVRARQALLEANERLEQRVQERTAEVRNAADKLRRSEELLRAFYDSPGMLRGIVELVDNDILIESANAVQAAVYGRTPESLRGALASELGVAQSVIGLWREKIQESEKRGEPLGFEYSTDFRSPGGWGEAIVSPLHMSPGGRRLFAYVARDITKRKRLERQILEISDHEQVRIGQDLHDNLCQQLIATAFSLSTLEQQLAGKSRSDAATVRRIGAQLNNSITEARDVTRSLYPVKLETNGLASALEELAEITTHRHRINCEFECPATAVVRNVTTAQQLYRIALEAVTNAVKHSGARQILIQFGMQKNQLRLTITDDGKGLPESRQESGGLGLHIMEYRARTLGGDLEIKSPAGGGMTISCCIPAKFI